MRRVDEESIVQSEKACWLCGNTNANMLERHEAFFGAYRQKSIDLELTVLLCADSCHRNGRYAAHVNKDTNLAVKQAAQEAAMHYYGWNTRDFVDEFGKNYLDEWRD